MPHNYTMCLEHRPPLLEEIYGQAGRQQRPVTHAELTRKPNSRTFTQIKLISTTLFQHPLRQLKRSDHSSVPALASSPHSQKRPGINPSCQRGVEHDRRKSLLLSSSAMKRQIVFCGGAFLPCTFLTGTRWEEQGRPHPTLGRGAMKVRGYRVFFPRPCCVQITPN